MEFEEANEFGELLGLLRHLCNEGAWTGGKFQGSFFGAENVELLLVVKDSDVRVACNIEDARHQRVCVRWEG